MKTIQEKRAILEGKDQLGQHYCEAIDGNWGNRAPASGYSFATKPDGTCQVYYNQVFICYDGWDSTRTEEGIFRSLKDAVEVIWAQYGSSIAGGAK